MKKLIAILMMITVVLTSTGVECVSAEEINSNTNLEENSIVDKEESNSNIIDDSEENESQSDINVAPEENIYQEENKQNTELSKEEMSPEENDQANSWRYENGILKSTENNAKRSRSKSVYNSNATKMGIDVSEHNGQINWEQVKASGVEFAIIRCGYGQNKTGQDDKQWIRNVTECERLGIPYGVYLYSYAKNTQAALSEAQHVLRLINGHDLSYPVYFDMEDNSTQGCDLSEIAKTFCNSIKSAGYAVGVYANLFWWNTFLTDSCFSNWYRWVAQYNSSCEYKGEYAMWQYTSRGRVSGIAGNVDMNYLIGNPDNHGIGAGINIPNELKDIVTYSAHMSDVGWMNSVANGRNAGLVGQEKQLEALQIETNKRKGIGIECETDVVGLGWQEAVADGSIAGTVGQGRAVEALKLKLTGENAKNYNLYYRVYVRSIGWLDWATNGEEAGSIGYDYPIESYQIVILTSGDDAPGKTDKPFYNEVEISQQAHISDIGWQNTQSNGNIIGTVGKNKGIEAYKISIKRKNLGIEYTSCIKGNWQKNVVDGAVSGTTGEAKHIEAIQMKLTGADKDKYRVFYRVHVSNLGWLGWTSDGEKAGTENYGYAIEAIQIYILANDSNEAPELGTAYEEKVNKVVYEAHVSDVGWQTPVSDGMNAGTTGRNKGIEALKVKTNIPDLSVEYTSADANGKWNSVVSNGEISGTTGQAKTLGAIRIKLSGAPSNEYNIFYRVHVSNFGWLGWTCNNQLTGTKGYGDSIEAIQIVILSKTDNTAPELGEAYKEKNIGVTYCAHVQDIGWQKRVKNGELAGTTGRAKAIEAFRINIADGMESSGVEYQAHVRNLGWQKWVKNGELAGTTGRALSVEAIKIKLSSELKKEYSVYYRVHVQDKGWQDWMKDGKISGTTGQAKAIEAIQVKLVKK